MQRDLPNTAPPSPRSEGRLSPLQQWRMAMAAVRWRANPRSRAPLAEGSTRLQRLDMTALDHVAPPADPVAQAALEAATRLQPPWLTQHVLRTYAWGSLLALNADLHHDRRLFFVAAVLHDIGLTEVASEPQSGCFAVRGARAADTLLREAGASHLLARTAAKAIALHLDLEVTTTQGAEAHLLHAGAGLDVIGRRHREVPAPLRAAVLARHPRLGLKQAFCTCMRAEAAHARNTRIGVLVNRLGFLDLIGKAPFED